ncbi:MAG: hypothetical protein ACI8YQ_004037, partial [Polaribacter sp.]
MFRKRISLLLFPLFLLLSQCRPIQEEKLTSIQWDFSNPEVVK